MSFGFIGECARALQGMVEAVAQTVNVSEEQITNRSSEHWRAKRQKNITSIILLSIFIVTVLIVFGRK